MKSIKMLGVAVVAATALMALVGVGTAAASQTTLCKAQENLCATAWPAETEFTAVSPKVHLSASFGSMTCGSSMTLKNNAKAGEPLGWQVTGLSWSSCTGCTQVATTALPAGSIAATSGGNGTVTPSSGEVEMKNCALGAICKFKLAGSSLKLKGGASGGAKLEAVEAPVELSGFGCGKTGTLSASGENGYAFTTAKAPGSEAVANPSLFAAGVATEFTTHLCRVQQSPCDAENGYPLGIEIKATSAKSVFSTTLGVNASCEPVSVAFKVEKASTEGVSGKVTEMAWNGCHDCSFTEASKLPSVSLAPTGSGNGVLTTTSQTTLNRELCSLPGGGFGSCPMTIGSESHLGVGGGKINSTAEMSAKNVHVSVTGGPCEKYTLWNAGTEKGSQPFVITSVNGLPTGSVFVE